MRVLLADDDAFYRYSLRKSLDRWGYEVVTASDGREALDMLLGEDPPSIAILDWMMPGMDGVAICSRVREQRKDPYVYIILITAKDQKQDVIAGLEAQADDYLIKPFDLEELRARLKSGKRIVDLQAALASKQQELSYRATHDSLTGIWNRSAILDILHQELECARSMKKPLCLALADIDKFKYVNDTYGHAAGDAVLVDVAQRLQSAIRHYDTIGRYGGEEFIVVMPGVARQRACKIAERLRTRVAEGFFQVLDQQVPITMSMGVAADTGTGSVSLLLRSADEALYRAKALGRNCVEVSWGGSVKTRTEGRRQSI
jgi:two-component system cell cycle response regulator